MIKFINPYTQQDLFFDQEALKDKLGNVFPKINGIYRFVEDTNYTQNFGFQWNKFEQTQIDRLSQNQQSKERFFAVTDWDKQDLTNQNILEVGSGAGRFSQIVLDYTKANLYSVDYSTAVEANYRNNAHHGNRFCLAQASIYDLPFAKENFDKVFCFGVLQHTPDVEKSIKCLIEMAKKGGEVIVDFYPIKGWWTKIHAKYLFRPYTKRCSNQKLLQLIEKNIDWLIKYYQFFEKMGLGKFLNRFLPICDIKHTLPPNLTPKQLKEWAILDTFDMFSPQYDQPQKLKTVKKYFEAFGMKNIQADFITYGQVNTVAVVKGIKR